MALAVTVASVNTTLSHTTSNQTLMSSMIMRVGTNLLVQSHTSSTICTVANVYSHDSYTTIVVPITHIRCTETYYSWTTFFLPSNPITKSDVQCTATVTQCVPDSGMVTKQANTATGVVGGLIGGSVIGFVLTVVITAITAILISKHHKNGERCHQSRYL